MLLAGVKKVFFFGKKKRKGSIESRGAGGRWIGHDQRGRNNTNREEENGYMESPPFQTKLPRGRKKARIPQSKRKGKDRSDRTRDIERGGKKKLPGIQEKQFFPLPERRPTTRSSCRNLYTWESAGQGRIRKHKGVIT